MNDPLNIILAEDDKDDCLIFNDAIQELSLSASLQMVHDGEQLMQHLETVLTNLPDALFLDLNMPRKNGVECLTEIKRHPTLKKIPVIIYSTSYDRKKAHMLFKTGANYYICKPSDYEELKNIVQRTITLVKQNNDQVMEENFYINKIKTIM